MDVVFYDARDARTRNEMMTWTGALWRGLVVVVYFVVATVWLPDFVLTMGPVEEAAPFVQDLVSVIVWGGALVAGMIGLRRAQARGLFQ